MSKLRAADELLVVVRSALASEDEIAHGEAWSEARGGLGVCAYCDDEWPCRTQRGIDRLLRYIGDTPVGLRGAADKISEAMG